MKRLKKIYIDFINSKEYAELGGMPETLEVSDEFYDLLKHFPQETAFKMDAAYSNCVLYNEMQGFVYGFRYAVELMIECMPKGGDSNG